MFMIRSPNADEISDLPFSIKELHHPSRQRIGYHLFLGYYFTKYNELSSVDKYERMYFPHNPQVLADDISVDSTDTLPTIHISEVMKDAGKSWRLCNESVKNAWDMRALSLNKRPIPGHFSRLPRQISIDGVEENLKIALQMDWSNFCKVMKKSITRSPKSNHAEQYLRFGRELIQLSNHAHFLMYLSYLVRVALFGNYYEQIKKNEIVYQTPSVTVIHITSLDRMKSLFSLGGLLSVFIKNATGIMMHSTRGNLSLEIDGKEMN